MVTREVFWTQLGWMGIELTSRGVARLVFDHPSERGAWRALGGPEPAAGRNEGILVEFRERLVGYAAGQPDELDELPVDWSGNTPFQERVLRACRAIPRSATASYAELARRAGSPGASRAVGGVMARNRIPLIIPCHRVVASGGALGGFSSRSGLQMKERLLRMEAALAAVG